MSQICDIETTNRSNFEQAVECFNSSAIFQSGDKHGATYLSRAASTYNDWLPSLELQDRQKSADGLFTLAAGAAPQTEVQPENYQMSSRIFSFGWVFDINSKDGKPEGTVEQKVFNFRKTFEYKDNDGNSLATGQQRLLSWGTKIDIADNNGSPLGSIQERVFSSLWRPHTVYSVLDEKGDLLAVSDKVEFFSTKFTLKNKAGEKIATIERPWLNVFRDNWDITINKPNEIDKRLLYMIPAYKTSADAERKQNESDSSSKRKKN